MYIEVGQTVRAVCDDGSVFTGQLFALDIQLCEADNNKPHAVAFISQDKRFIDKEGDFGHVNIWVDTLKALDVVEPPKG